MERCSTGATRRAMPPQPFTHAFRKTQGSPAASVIENLGMRRASNITNIWRFRVRLCQVKRRCRQCGAMAGKNHEWYKRFCSNSLKNREFGHKCYMAPLSDRAPVEIENCLSFTISKPRGTWGAQTILSITYRIMYMSSNFAQCTKKTPIWTWRTSGVVRVSIVFWLIPSAVSFSTRLNPDRGPIGSWPLQ